MVEHGINVVINIGIVRLPSQQWLKVGDRAAKYQFEKINPEFKTFLRNANDFFDVTQLAITYSKLTIETLEQGVKYVQS